jgi:hypothetical protein
MKATSADNRGGNSSLPSNTTTYSMAECNRIDIANPAIKGQVSTYYNNGQLVNSYLNVNLTSVPAEISSTSTYYLQLYRWYERAAGQPQVNSTPVTMYFVQKSTGLVSNPNGSDKISKSILDAIISSAKLATVGVTAANFFDRHFVVLTGMDLTWDAVKFAYYNSAVGTTAIASGDVLLPAFYANPNAYIAANPFPDLYVLHPNYGYRTSSASENDYLGMTEQICAGFFGRVPASVDMPLPQSGFFGAIRSWFEKIRAQFRQALTAMKMGRRL